MHAHAKSSGFSSTRGKSLGTRLLLSRAVRPEEGLERDYDLRYHPRPQAQARAALTVALGQAVEQLIVIGSFALKECCGWEENAG